MVRLTCTYYSHSNEKYKLEIHDTTLVTPSAYDFNMPYGQAPIYAYENDEENIFSEIVGCNMTFVMNIEDSNHTDFYEDFVTSAEGRFYVKLIHVFKPTPMTESPIVKFIGKITHDLALLEDAPDQTLSLSALDGLMELDTIEFAGFNQYFSLKKIFINELLLSSSINDYFFDDASNHILSVYNQYISDEKLTADDMFSYTYIKDYYKNEDNGLTKRPSCLEVLRELLRGLGARMYFEDGAYTVEQISMRNTENPTYSKYLKDYTYDGTDNPGVTDIDYITDGATYETQDILIAAHPSYTYIAPIRKAVLTQSGKLANNRIFDLYYSDNSTSGVTLIETINDLEDGLKIYCYFNLNPWIVKNDTYTLGFPKYGYIEIEVQIRVGTKYLSGSGNILYGSGTNTLVIDDPEWDGDSTKRVHVYVPSFIMYTDLQPNAIDTNYDITIISPELPETGEVYFNISSTGVYSNINEDAINPLLSPYSSKWNTNSNELTIVKNLNEEYNEGDTIYTIVNDLNNTKIYRTEYNMGDFPGENTPKKIKIDYPSPATDSNGWTSADIATSTIFQLMALNDIVAFRRIPRKRLHTSAWINPKGTLGRPLMMIDRLVYKTDIFIPMTLKINTGLDVMDVIWIAIGKDYTSMNTPTEQNPTVRNGLTGASAGIETNLQSGTDTNYNSYYTEGTISGDTYDLSDYDGFPDPDEFTMVSINHSIKIYVNSTLFHIKDAATADLTNTECSLDYDNTLIQFNRDLTGRFIRVEATSQYVNQEPTA